MRVVGRQKTAQISHGERFVFKSLIKKRVKSRHTIPIAGRHNQIEGITRIKIKQYWIKNKYFQNASENSQKVERH